MITTLSEVNILVRDLARALRRHIEDEAKRAGVAPSALCPCHSDELARAAAFLDDDEDPEPVMDEAGEPWAV